ncbi:hypothetical protein ERJ75_000914800 [Trypanosoma vivax]|nr:hypothetical protein ERJ75_000914800 [Trypanosoma vivax]
MSDQGSAPQTRRATQQGTSLSAARGCAWCRHTAPAIVAGWRGEGEIAAALGCACEDLWVCERGTEVGETKGTRIHARVCGRGGEKGRNTEEAHAACQQWPAADRDFSTRGVSPETTAAPDGTSRQVLSPGRERAADTSAKTPPCRSALWQLGRQEPGRASRGRDTFGQRSRRRKER